MNIAQDKVVELDYVLTVDGEQIDHSEPGEPLVYLHGHGLIIPGLERALEGRAAGEEFSVTVQPEDGYGERNEESVEELDSADFDEEVEVGATYFMQAADGTMFPFTVLAVADGKVKADFNAPLAGKVLNFTGKVLSVRDATEQELDQGYAGVEVE